MARRVLAVLTFIAILPPFAVLVWVEMARMGVHWLRHGDEGTPFRFFACLIAFPGRVYTGVWPSWMRA